MHKMVAKEKILYNDVKNQISKNKKQAKSKNACENQYDWTCVKCHNLNFGFRVTCNRCHISKCEIVALEAGSKMKLRKEYNEYQILEDRVRRAELPIYCPLLAKDSALYGVLSSALEKGGQKENNQDSLH